MLVFLAVFAVSAVALFLVQSMDIECANPGTRRRNGVRRSAAPAGAPYLNGAAVGGLR